MRLDDLAEVNDDVENIRNAGLANGRPAVLVILYRQPGGNIIDTAVSIGTAGQGLNLGIVRGQVFIPGIGTIANLGLLARALESVLHRFLGEVEKRDFKANVR